MRFFHQSDEKTFSLFCESGLKREWQAEIVSEDSVELTVSIPIPSDDLMKTAGYHAINTNFEETNEVFTIQAPRRFANDPKEKIIYFPSVETPLWIIFQYDLEILKDEEPLKAKIDLVSKITSQASGSNTR